MDHSKTTFCFLITLSQVSIASDRILPSTFCNFPAIYNFGASNSDTGGLAAAFIQFKPPNGNTFFGMPAGRMCDGRLIVDFTAESLKLPFLSSYLNSLAINFKHGANFATAGSTITFPTMNILPEGGVHASLMPLEEDFANALYTFDIGQNDLLNGLLLNMTVPQVIATIPDMVYQFSKTIRDLYNLGARSFWVYNTRPIGCFPSILTIYPAAERDSAGCAKQYNELAQRFNAELKKALAQLGVELRSATVVYVDIYSGLYSLYTDPIKNGFESPLVACCGHGGKHNYNVGVECGQTISVNGMDIRAGSCKDPSVRISWDGVHFTEAANKFAFDLVSTGSFNNPPIPLKLACHRR
ncbi:Esterase [Hibiscus syriacus]|uniref:Esterase n=1 Tax=Hibiscus syriacus TaxID=106335 RepID=A0A6A3B4D7_HIBSY|nr:Esterase [Hibiscus syriacus]